jgi:hypothetical protein
LRVLFAQVFRHFLAQDAHHLLHIGACKYPQEVACRMAEWQQRAVTVTATYKGNGGDGGDRGAGGGGGGGTMDHDDRLQQEEWPESTTKSS